MIISILELFLIKILASWIGAGAGGMLEEGSTDRLQSLSENAEVLK